VPWIEPVTLEGARVRLEPLSQTRCAELADAARDGELWNLWYTNIPEPGAMAAEIDRRLQLREQGSMMPFTIVDRETGRAAGMTTYMHIDAVSKRVEIGSTWIRTQLQRTAANTECKLLLLSHAFDSLHCIAVEFRTSSANAQSRAAIERLGAKLDGILRSHGLHKDGSLRDSCVYSITAAEWPAVRRALRARLRV
jgi:RimJ/RimL family protein N-acetyltransferase